MSRSRRVIDVSSHLIEPSLPPDNTEPIDWRALFENDHPVELEIGSGKGLFLASAACSEAAQFFRDRALAQIRNDCSREAEAQGVPQCQGHAS